MNFLRFPTCLIMGKNNFIEPNVKIHKNVIIGNNNKIYDGTTLYPNTKIGDNNTILNNNIFGEHAVDSREFFKEKIHNGLEIKDNNFFHVNNLIFGGSHNKTVIGNNNKFLSNIVIHHDTIVQDSVILYPSAKVAGLSKLLTNSTMGMNSCIQQKCVLGQYSMIGMGCIASHNVFPFFLYFKQKYIRPNIVKIPDEIEIEKYDETIRTLIEDLKNNKCDKELVKKYELPDTIKSQIYDFLDLITINKI